MELEGAPGGDGMRRSGDISFSPAEPECGTQPAGAEGAGATPQSPQPRAGV